MINYNKEYVITIIVQDSDDSIKTLKVRSTDSTCIVCSWARYLEVEQNESEKEKFSHGGVYMLVNNAGTSKKSAYITIDGVRSEWEENHWTHVVFFTAQNKTDPINVGMSEYIARHLLAIAEKNNYNIVNSDELESLSDEDEIKISLEDEITCDRYLEAISAIFPHFGIDICVEDTAESEEEGEEDESAEGEDEAEHEHESVAEHISESSPCGENIRSNRMPGSTHKSNTEAVDSSIIYYCDVPNSEYKAKGYAISHPKNREKAQIVVKEGSYASKHQYDSLEDRYRKLRRKLLNDGSLDDRGEIYVFTKDCTFRTPSRAGRIVTGRTSNGYIDWIDENGNTLGDNLGRR